TSAVSDRISVSHAVFSLIFRTLLICMLVYLLFFFLLLRPPPTSTLFPYTTLFRSQLEIADGPPHVARHQIERALRSRIEAVDVRSEEHTSELQSHLNLVCRLLLEKKKKKNKQ